MDGVPGSGRCVDVARTCTVFNTDHSAVCELVCVGGVSFVRPRGKVQLMYGKRLVGLFPLERSPLSAGPEGPIAVCHVRPRSYCAVNRVSGGFRLSSDAICTRVQGCSVPAQRVNGCICTRGRSVSGLCGSVGPL